MGRRELHQAEIRPNPNQPLDQALDVPDTNRAKGYGNY